MNRVGRFSDSALRKAIYIMKSMILLGCSAFIFGSFCAQDAAAMAGDATPYGARNPVACRNIVLASVPTAAQAAEMVQCNHELINSGSGELWLLENLRITVGAATPFVAAYSQWVMAEADVRSRVYPLRGSFTRSVCKSRRDAAIYGNADLNCYEKDVADAKGVCWKTSFGDWRCLLTGAASGHREPTRPPQLRSR
jgi:hypothetical protein